MRSTAASTSSVETGRLCSARRKPSRSLVSEKSSRVPLVLTICGGRSSAVSQVVKRLSHCAQRRRRRIASPASLTRESMTWVSREPQKGHFMKPPVSLLRWPDWMRVLGILMYFYVHFGSCALAASNLAALATVSRGFHPARPVVLTVDRKLRRQLRHFAPHPRDHRLVVRCVEHVGDQVGELLGFDFLEAARGHRRGADADAAGDEGLLRVVRDGILVDRDVGAAQERLGFLAGKVLGAQVDQEDVALGAAGDDP